MAAQNFRKNETQDKMQETYKKRAEEICAKLEKARKEGQKKYKVKKIVHKTSATTVTEPEVTVLPPPKYVIK